MSKVTAFEAKTRFGELLERVSRGGGRELILPAGTLLQEGSFTTFSITRDGRSIAYLEARREGDIWLADFGAASGSQP